MINAPHDKEFVFHDGTRVKNILELVAVLEHLSDHDFRHFVNFHKNDFATWIDHVLLDKYLSGKLRQVDSKSDTIKVLKDRINDVALNNELTGHHTHSSTFHQSVELEKSEKLLHHVKVGDSIIKIPKLESQSSSNHIVAGSVSKDTKDDSDYKEFSTHSQNSPNSQEISDLDKKHSFEYVSKGSSEHELSSKHSKDSEDRLQDSKLSSSDTSLSEQKSSKHGFIQRSKQFFAKRKQERQLKKELKKHLKEELKESKKKIKEDKRKLKESQKKSDVSKNSENNSERNFKNLSAGTTIGMGVKEKVHEQKEALKSKKNWFKIFSKKTISEDELAKLEFEEEDKLRPERELLEEMDSESRENALWVALYIILVLLIITLLVYKLFL